MATHAVLSPSGANKWMNCPSAPAMEQGIVEEPSPYADEGTAAHYLAAKCLSGETDAGKYLGYSIAVYATGECELLMPAAPSVQCQSTWSVNEDMVRYVQQYIDSVREHAGDDLMIVEVPVSVGQYTGEKGATGTSDVVVAGADEVQVHDLKYGRGGVVSAEHNKQLMIYALGACDAVSAFSDIKTVKLYIHQVRLSSEPSVWSCTIEELVEFGESVKEAGRMALTLLGAKPYTVHGMLQPGDHCRSGFCKAQAHCTAFAEYATEGQDFPDLGSAESAALHMGVEELAGYLGKAQRLSAFIDAAFVRVNQELLAGTPVPGWKLVKGRAGDRAWISADDVEVVMRDSMGLKHDVIYTRKLITPTAAEKAAKAGQIGPKQWKKLEALVVRAPGKPRVVEEGAKGEPYLPEAQEFDDLTTTGE